MIKLRQKIKLLDVIKDNYCKLSSRVAIWIIVKSSTLNSIKERVLIFNSIRKSNYFWQVFITRGPTERASGWSESGIHGIKHVEP